MTSGRSTFGERQDPRKANLKPILAGLCAAALTYLCFLTWVHSKAASFAEGQDRTDWIAIAVR